MLAVTAVLGVVTVVSLLRAGRSLYGSIVVRRRLWRDRAGGEPSPSSSPVRWHGAATRALGRAMPRVVAGAAADPARGDALADVVDAMARGLRTGVPPVDAVRAAAAGAPSPLREELAACVAGAERGAPLAEAVDRWAAATGADGPRLVAAAFAVNRVAGGDPGRALAGVADTLRERRALQREVRALSSQARLSAVVIGVAPAAFGILTTATDRAIAAFVLGTPIGAGCVAAGLLLEVAGWRWMGRIARSVR